MERLTTYKSECKREMICRYEDCMTDEEYCPHLNEDNCPCLQEILEKLAEYEDFEEIFRSKMTDAACDFLKDKEEFARWLDRNKWITKRCDEYARAEEQGKLLKKPCAVGDTLYCDGKYFASHCEGEVHSFKVSDIVTEIRSYFRGEVDYCFNFEDVGKIVFLTKEEAEAALREVENEQIDSGN